VDSVTSETSTFFFDDGVAVMRRYHLLGVLKHVIGKHNEPAWVGEGLVELTQLLVDGAEERLVPGSANLAVVLSFRVHSASEASCIPGGSFVDGIAGEDIQLVGEEVAGAHLAGVGDLVSLLACDLDARPRPQPPGDERCFRR
jgi:hypothetical protein